MCKLNQCQTLLFKLWLKCLLRVSHKLILPFNDAGSPLSLQPGRRFAVHVLRRAMHHRPALHQAEQTTCALFRFSRLAANKRAGSRSASSGAVRYSELSEGAPHHYFFSASLSVCLSVFLSSHLAQLVRISATAAFNTAITKLPVCWGRALA